MTNYETMADAASDCVLGQRQRQKWLTGRFPPVMLPVTLEDKEPLLCVRRFLVIQGFLDTFLENKPVQVGGGTKEFHLGFFQGQMPHLPLCSQLALPLGFPCRKDMLLLCGFSAQMKKL